MKSKTKIKKSSWHIERLDPKKKNLLTKKLIAEHVVRYEFTRPYIRGKTVVDLGCGSGYGSNLIKSSGARTVYGIDIDKDAITYAEKNYALEGIHFIQNPAEKTGLPDNSVDVVITFETIEHVDNAETLITEIRRILKRNGICILSTPNKEYSYNDNPYHVKEFTPSELKKLLGNFFSIQFYGQRKINTSIMTLYKYLYRSIPFNALKRFLRFRPWENVKIKRENRLYKVPYLYIVAVCKKT